MNKMVALILMTLAWWVAPVQASTLEKMSVHGKSLEGNLEGNRADREVFVHRRSPDKDWAPGFLDAAECVRCHQVEPARPSCAPKTERMARVDLWCHGSAAGWAPWVGVPADPRQRAESGY